MRNGMREATFSSSSRSLDLLPGDSPEALQAAQDEPLRQDLARIELQP